MELKNMNVVKKHAEIIITDQAVRESGKFKIARNPNSFFV